MAANGQLFEDSCQVSLLLRCPWATDSGSEPQERGVKKTKSKPPARQTPQLLVEAQLGCQYILSGPGGVQIHFGFVFGRISKSMGWLTYQKHSVAETACFGRSGTCTDSFSRLCYSAALNIPFQRSRFKDHLVFSAKGWPGEDIAKSWGGWR